VPRPTDLKFGSCTALSSLSLWLKHRNFSLLRSRVGLRLHLRYSGAGMRLCVRVCTILTTLYHTHHYHYAAMVKSFNLSVCIVHVHDCTCSSLNASFLATRSELISLAHSWYQPALCRAYILHALHLCCSSI
jgi:hypothetical protein